MKTKIESFAGVSSCNLSVNTQPEESSIFEIFLSSRTFLPFTLLINTFHLCLEKNWEEIFFDGLHPQPQVIYMSLLLCWSSAIQGNRILHNRKLDESSSVLEVAWMRKYIGAKTCWNGSRGMNDCADLFPFQNPAGCTPPHVIQSEVGRNTLDKLWEYGRNTVEHLVSEYLTSSSGGGKCWLIWCFAASKGDVDNVDSGLTQTLPQSADPASDETDT